jgi:predicted signal transduction protein with EAL and GGDEF domain
MKYSKSTITPSKTDDGRQVMAKAHIAFYKEAKKGKDRAYLFFIIQ